MKESAWLAGRCFLMAEIGINHNGDMGLAREMIQAAEHAGADAVKFQNYQTEDFISDRSLTYEYVSQGKLVVESQYDMFKRCELTRADLQTLREECDRVGMSFLSTPTSEQGIRDLVEVGALLLKNGSDYLQHLPLIQAMARTGLPTILSTGMATLEEVEDAVKAFRAAGGGELAVLHCTSSYPTPASDVHLRKIPTLAKTFNCRVGLSDHTDGIVAALGAVALGASVIEKHFTLDKNLPGPDHHFSSNPMEWASLVQAVRTLESNLGQATIGPTGAEAKARSQYRLSCVAARSLNQGQVVTEADIVFQRPSGGFVPKERDQLLGRKMGRAVNRGHVFHAEDFVT